MLRTGDHRELQAAVLALKGVEAPVRSRINKAVTSTMGPEWKSLVEVHATRHMDTRILAAGARVAAGNPPSAVAANSRRKVGRLVPSENWPAFEFGAANREAYSRYTRKNRKSGGSHSVERRAMRGLPPRARKGRVVYPAFAEWAPRAVRLTLQIIVKTVYDAAEGKKG